MEQYIRQQECLPLCVLLYIALQILLQIEIGIVKANYECCNPEKDHWVKCPLFKPIH
jgi:hypothetical protein